MSTDHAEPAAPAARLEASADQPLRVQVAYGAGPEQVELVSLQLPAGATVADALQASGLPARLGLGMATMRVGIWARQQPLATPLRDLDRVEIYRPLTVDPKEARRQRYQGHRDKYKI